MTMPASDKPGNQVSRRKLIQQGVALGGVAGTALPAAVIAEAGTSGDSQPPGTAVEQTAGHESPAPRGAENGPPFVTSGVVPRIGVQAGLKGPRSESGIGALVPWGGRLWFITYTAHTAQTGSGTGLYWVDDEMTVTHHPASVVGTYANRFVHRASEQMIIGPHVIDADNKVRTITSLVDYRLTATMAHLKDPANKVYMLGMESHLFEVDVHTLETRLLFTLDQELGLPAGSRPHYKGGFTAQDRVIVANNTYHERDCVEGVSSGGRLAEWDGQGKWKIIESTAFTDVVGIPMGEHANALALGWDRASAILAVLARGRWQRYRLPKASQCYDHAWYTEWPRIREVETERFLMDAHGMFYELPRLAYGGHVWGLRPISQHLRVVPDFCSWKGLLVLAGNQNTAVTGNELVGEPQSNLWFGKTDDLWSFGKPQGWGGPWYESKIEANQPSDPYLMTGFEHKCLHLTCEADEPVTFTLEVDFLGAGKWRKYGELTVVPGGYEQRTFPTGFGAHWARLIADRSCVATAQFVYT